MQAHKSSSWRQLSVGRPIRALNRGWWEVTFSLHFPFNCFWRFNHVHVSPIPNLSRMVIFFKGVLFKTTAFFFLDHKVRKNMDCPAAPVHPDRHPLREAAEALQQDPARGQRWAGWAGPAAAVAPFVSTYGWAYHEASVVWKTVAGLRLLPGDSLAYLHCYNKTQATRHLNVITFNTWYRKLYSLFFRIHVCTPQQCVSPTADAPCDFNGAPGCHFWRNWHVGEKWPKLWNYAKSFGNSPLHGQDCGQLPAECREDPGR